MKQPEIRLAGLYTATDVIQPFGPLLIGERANATGSKKFREMLLADDFDGMLRLMQSQAASHVLDLSTAYTGRDEAADMRKICFMAAAGVTQPLMIDSTNPEAIEAALKVYPGRPIINSVNLEDGGKTLNRIAGLAKKYGAMLTALTIDEKGMALDAARKVETALRIRDILVKDHGLRDSDIFFDCLTFTIGSGDESLYNAALETLAAIRELKRLLPECYTLLGVSNVSYGLKPACRRVVNSVFLAEAVSAGLNAAIVDAAKILPLRDISPEEKELALDLVYNKRGGGKNPLAAIIKHFEADASGETKTRADTSLPAEALLGEKIIKGSREGLEDILSVLLEKYGPADIINNLLVPVMRKIGALFGKGEMLLPFVLAAAETMREAVRLLEPYLPRGAENTAEGRKKIVLATVRGDVHDIGKNLVDIILSNNGYTVFNIGIKQSAEAILTKALECKADVIALSGLLVKSALVMKDNLEVFAENGLTIPVFLGGAALTRSFVAGECAPLYGGPVVYCKDPFDALAALEALQKGRLEAARADLPRGGEPVREKGGVLPGYCPRVEPPFSGARHTGVFPLTEALRNFSKNMLFRGRWGFHRKALSAHEYERLIRDSAEPQFSQTLAVLEPHLDFRAAYGYFPCRAEGNSLVAGHGGKKFVFEFPRQNQPDGLCVADFFRAENNGETFVPFFALTIGKAAAARVREAFEKDSYKQYLLLHGLAAELTEAFAETLNKRIAAELGLAALTGRPDFRGTRYGFGYAACPDLNSQRPLFELLRAEDIGIELTETNMLEPEYSTMGIIAYHPEAKYFSV